MNIKLKRNESLSNVNVSTNLNGDKTTLLYRQKQEIAYDINFPSPSFLANFSNNIQV